MMWNKLFDFFIYLTICAFSIYFIIDLGYGLSSVLLFLLLSLGIVYSIKTISYIIKGKSHCFKKNNILVPSEYNLEDIDYIEYRVIEIVGKNYKCLSKTGQIKYIHFDDEYCWEIRKY